MINDIAITPSPALARKLKYLSSICSIEVDPRIIMLANNDLIGEEAFDPIICKPSPLRIAMTQFMIDCNMRTIIPAIHKEMDRETILNAVRIVGANHLTIATKNILPWKMLLKHQAIKQNTVFGKLSKTVAETFDKERRAGILIIDWNAGHNDPAHMAMMTMLAREFPRTIVYASHKEIMPRQGELLPKHQSFKPEKFRWMELTQILFPEMPNDCSRSCRDFFHAHIHRPTWKVRHVDDLCMLYNTFLPRIILGKDVVG